MKEYDFVVIGGGTGGLTLLYKALQLNKKVALLTSGPIGGTCQNFGCVPSKMLIYPADVIETINSAGNLGIEARITNINFSAIMERMRQSVAQSVQATEDNLKNQANLDYYHSQAHFTGDYTLATGVEQIRGKKIFVATGSRPMVPPIKGLKETGFLDEKTVLRLSDVPESMVFIGGGYIAAEYGHFFSAMGTKVTILQDADRLVPHEEPEISHLLAKELGKRLVVHTDMKVISARKNGKISAVTARDSRTGRESEFPAEKIFVATGRESNADLLKGENSGIETNEKGYIEVNDYLETSKNDIRAFGDAIGRQMFTHAADKEAEIAWHNAIHEKRRKMDFGSVPHAVYTWPQIASVGMTEAHALQNHDILVGKARYSDTVRGMAMRENEGFAKAIVEKETGKILGFHIIGPDAPIIIQEVVNVIARGGAAEEIKESMHIFPSLGDLVTEALGNLQEVREFAGGHA